MVFLMRNENNYSKESMNILKEVKYVLLSAWLISITRIVCI